MDYKKIVDKIVKDLDKKKVPFYSCGILFCKNKNVKPKIEVVIKRPARFNKEIVKNIPKIFMGLRVKIV